MVKADVDEIGITAHKQETCRKERTIAACHWRIRVRELRCWRGNEMVTLRLHF